MHATLTCPACRRELRIPRELVGEVVRCPMCHITLETADADGERADATVLLESTHEEGTPPREQDVPELKPEPPHDPGPAPEPAPPVDELEVAHAPEPPPPAKKKKRRAANFPPVRFTVFIEH